MNFLISTQVELLKTRRTASTWIIVMAATFIPGVYLLFFLLNPKEAIQDMGPEPWAVYLMRSWQVLCDFFLPIYIILLSTLVTQIEFKNNTWKQLFATPQSFGNIFFSKFLTIHILIFAFLLLFNTLVFTVGIIADLANPSFAFLEHKIDWMGILKTNVKIYISILGITAIQYWLSLRFKNFVVSTGIGLALMIGGLIAWAVQWTHVYKYPYAFAILTFESTLKPGRPFLENHELNSICYFLFFTLLAFIEMKTRKDKG
jgi:hypothetical protein